MSVKGMAIAIGLAALAACSDAVIKQGETAKLRLEEGESRTVNDIRISVSDFTDAIVAGEGGMMSEYTRFTLTLSQGGLNITEEARYGSAFTNFGYILRVKDCATGTRDWKSFCEIEVGKQ